MKKVTKLFLLLFVLLSSLFSSHATFANSVSDSTTIKLQVTVTEAMLPQKCTFGFENNQMNLSHSIKNDCKFNSSILIKEASQLVSMKSNQQSGLEFVTITVTAP